MRFALGIFALCFLFGCSSPPKPPTVQGDYRPVNTIKASKDMKGDMNEQAGRF